MKNEKRILRDIEKAYRMTMSDIASYKRQAGTINIDIVKQYICLNYFHNTNATQIWSYEDDDVNNIIVAMDMFDLQLWILENYDTDSDMLNSIEEELSYLTTFYINK